MTAIAPGVVGGEWRREVAEQPTEPSEPPTRYYHRTLSVLLKNGEKRTYETRMRYTPKKQPLPYDEVIKVYETERPTMRKLERQFNLSHYYVKKIINQYHIDEQRGTIGSDTAVQETAQGATA